MKHTDYKNIIEAAQNLTGSKAQTKSGAWRALKSWIREQHGTGLAHKRPGIPFGVMHANAPARDAWYNWQWRQRAERGADTIAVAMGYDPNDPNTPGRILDGAYTEHSKWCARAVHKLTRNGYGQLTPTTVYGAKPTLVNYKKVKHYYAAQDLIKSAVKSKKIPHDYDYIDFDSKGRAGGEALHHEIYDIRPEPLQVLLCVRETEGTKYGVKTTSKDYYIITRHGRGTIVIEAKKHTAAKAAKWAGDDLGKAIDVLQGKITMAAPRACADGIAYKKVAVVDDKYVSIYDSSPWKLGVERHDKALKDHNGGLYVYDTPAKAAMAVFPTDSDNPGAPKKVLKCRVSGKYVRYENDKLAFSHVCPVEEVDIEICDI